MTGDIHVSLLQMSLPSPSSLAPTQSRMRTFWYQLTQVVLEMAVKRAVTVVVWKGCTSCMLSTGPCRRRIPRRSVQHNSCYKDYWSRWLLPRHCVPSWCAAVVSSCRTWWCLCATYVPCADGAAAQCWISHRIYCSAAVCHWTGTTSW